MAVIRRAEVNWQGDLATGAGQVAGATSGAFKGLAVSWPSRTGEAAGTTSPEELLAAAHASCYSMALSGELGRAGSPPQSLSVVGEVSADRVDGRWTVVSSHLIVRGRVPGLDEARFREIAAAAKDGCPISRALAGNVAMSVDASLER